ncbi:MAG TPA: ABC transporter permease [Puia sp.]|nr:ABC transporter permease [Puia sp.]
MLKNYFKTAIRNLTRNKVYSFITITGLSVGIAVCLVIFVFIRYEQSYDSFHPDKDRIYRVMTRGTGKDDHGANSAVPFPLPTAMKNDFPDLTSAGIFSLSNLQLQVVDKAGLMEKKFKEKSGVYLMEPSFFSIFHFPWLAGDASRALQDPLSAAITQSTAERYFGDWKQAMGKLLKINNGRTVTIRGIIADPPSNSDFQLKVVLPYTFAGFYKSKDWWTINGEHGCYVLLPPNVSAATIDQRLHVFSKKYRSADNKNTQALQSLSEVHFDPQAGNFSGKFITRDRIQTLWLIAAFILIIACVNFINLSTAQAVNRAREVGVRKVLGSNRGQLTLQFLLEALLLVVTGVFLAVLIVGSLLGPIGKIMESPLNFELFRQTAVLVFLGGVTVVVTLLAGFYPALVLSSFNPITALKSRITARSARGISLRRGLVVFQFIIAQALIIGTLLILRQISYFENTSMGFSKEAIVSVPFPGDSLSRTRMDYLRNRLAAMKSIKEVSFNNTSPADDDNWWTGFNFDHAAKGIDFAAISKWVDANYLSTYSLPLVAGRNITTTDSIKEFLVNETLVKRLGFSNPNDILNREINLWNGFAVGPVVGVVKDFHSTSLKDSLSPVFMLNNKRDFNTAGIKIEGTDLTGSMKQIEKLWNEIFPSYVFEYQFLDEKIASFYKEESQLSTIYKLFAGIAIFLSCLGLYGLASFMAVQRIKEVGIRKVLGATIGNIVYLFSREFVILIGVAFVIAAPIAWYFVHQWVQHYAYRIPISGWIFLMGGILSVLVALATVSFQALKAAIANPVKNLRTE